MKMKMLAAVFLFAFVFMAGYLIHAPSGGGERSIVAMESSAVASGASGEQAQTTAPTAAGVPRGGIPLQRKQAGACTALAPADWAITNIDQQSSGLDLSNGTFGAGWLMMGVPPELRMNYPQYSSPEAVLYSTLQPRNEPPLQFSQPQSLGGGYMVREFEGVNGRGAVMYIVYPQPNGGFIWGARSAFGPKQLWKAYGPVAMAVALSVRCRVQLRASPGSAGSRPATTAEESTYNAQLGTEYAHDPETGENFLMSHAADYLENGPQGPGYYRKAGNETRKLAPGLAY